MAGTVAESASRRLAGEAPTPPLHALGDDRSDLIQRPESRRVATRRSLGLPTALAKKPASIGPQWRVMAPVKLAVAARAIRQSMLRKIAIEHDGHVYNATVRNISATGALIEGLWNVPCSTVFSIRLAQERVCAATVRWTREDRIGVEFSEPLKFTSDGQIAPLAARANPAVARAERFRLAG